MKILVIDDSLTVRRLAEIILTKAGYAVVLAENGAAGIKAASAGDIDFIMLDYVLPDMASEAVIDGLAAQTASRATPVIMISSKGDEIRKLHETKPTVVDYIAKPFQERVLLGILHHHEQRMKAAAAAKAAAEAEAKAATKAAEVEAKAATIKASEAAATHETAAGMPDLRKLLESRLTRLCAQIPEWEIRRAGSPPTPYYLPKLLSGELVADLEAALRTAQGRRDEEGRVILAGLSSIFSLHKLILLLERTGERGVLEVTLKGEKVRVYISSGLLGIATSTNVRSYCQGARYDYTQLSRQAIATGAAEQERTGEPFFLYQHRTGALKLTEDRLAALIQEQGQRAIMRTMMAEDAEFTFRRLEHLPDFVTANSVGDSLSQALLEVLRGVEDWRTIEAAIGNLSTVFVHADNFDSRVATLYLTKAEADVLGRIDDASAIGDIVAKCQLTSFEVFSILFRFHRLQLIRAKGDSGVPSPVDVLAIPMPH